MRLIDGFRDGRKARGVAQAISRLAGQRPLKGRRLQLMEVCGSHTVAIFKSGIRDLLPENVRLISGPGCPVCVTPVADIDRAGAIARLPDVVLTTFGDMMRVPGSRSSLDEERAGGADIRVVYSTLEALELARKHTDRRVVFFGAGFETTAPTVAAAAIQAEAESLQNFFVYSVHKTIPQAMRALLDTPQLHLDGFICPGHVSALIGSSAYRFVAGEYGRPSVVSGFEPLDILMSIYLILKQLAEGRSEVEIEYSRVVTPEGNTQAMEILGQVFEEADSHWRGIGVIPGSGLNLRERFAHRDALRVFNPPVRQSRENPACECGDILRGLKSPAECRLFATACTPERPIGACMVSSEGSCAANYKYSREDRLMELPEGRAGG